MLEIFEEGKIGENKGFGEIFNVYYLWIKNYSLIWVRKYW